MPKPPRDLKVLVVAPEVVGERVAGPNIRAIAFARHLARDFDATLAIPQGSSAAALGNDLPFKLVSWSRGDILSKMRGFDVAISQGTQWPARGCLKPLGAAPLHVHDLYNAFLFEHLASHPRKVSRWEFHAIRRLTRFLFQRGDYFLCASPQQRDLWLGVLYGTSRLEEAWGGGAESRDALESLIAVAPFGHDGGEVRKAATGPVLKGAKHGIGVDDDVLLWGGGIWNWFDPLTLIRAMKRLETDRPSAKLFFMASRHPDPAFRDNDMGVAAVKTAGELGLLDKTVFFNDGWIPFEQRADYLLEADLAVCAAPASPENHFSFRTRLLDALWAGVPVVCNDGSFLSDYVEEREIGFAFRAGDDAQLARLIARALEPDAKARFRENLAACRDELRWDNCLRPLTEYCHRVAAGEVPAASARREPLFRSRAQYLAYKLPTMLEKLADKLGLMRR